MILTHNIKLINNLNLVTFGGCNMETIGQQITTELKPDIDIKIIF